MNWKGGKSLDADGYKLTRMEHARSRKNGYVADHILVAEKALGRPLPDGAVVHHYGKKTENAKLVICQDQGYHALIHAREKALLSCGNANFRKCQFCKEWDDPANMVRNSSRGHYHRKCHAEYEMRRRYANKL